MAYAFGRVAQAQRGGADKANIFTAQDESQGAVVSDQGGNKRAFEAPGAVKASTEGSLEGAGTGGGEGATTQRQDEQPQQSAAKAVRAAQTSRENFPGIFGTLQSGISKASQDLQNEANSYVTNKTAEYKAPTLGKADYDAAIGGDETARTNVGKVLAGTPTIDYQAPAWKTDTAFSDVGLLDSDPGLRSLLSRQAGPGYTQGMASLDAAALRKNPEYGNMLREIKGGQQALWQQGQDLAASAPKDIKTAVEGSWGGAQQGAKDYLTQAQQAILAQNEREAAAQNAALEAAKKATGGPKAVKKQKHQALKEWQAAHKDQPAGWTSNLGIDSNAGLTWHPTYTANDFWSQGDFSGFRNIADLLGQGGQLPVAAPSPELGSLYSFDPNAYKSALDASFEAAKAKRPQYTPGVGEGGATQTHASTAGIEFEPETTHAKEPPAPTTTAYDVDNGTYEVPTQELITDNNPLPTPFQQIFDYLGKKGQDSIDDYLGTPH
jgi:uncharacterized membrane protein